MESRQFDRMENGKIVGFAGMYDAEDLAAKAGRLGGAHQSTWIRDGCRLICLIIALWFPITSQADDSYGDVVREHLALETLDSKAAVDGQSTREAELQKSDLALTLRIEAKAISQSPQVEPPPSIKFNSSQWLALAVALLLIGGLALGKLAPELLALLNQRFNPWAVVPAKPASFMARVRAEEEDFSEFLASFHSGSLASTSARRITTHSSMAWEPIPDVRARATSLVVRQRELLEEIGQATDEAVRLGKLKDLRREMSALKGETGLPELLLVWQVACALEGLIKQLIVKLANVTPSTLRTVAGGLELLENLCQPGMKLDLLASQPLRFLAVDDDLISRKAISLALKKSLNPPDLAEDGETALALATKHAYDLIFLDVQMPGMDGFELCTRIHKTDPNLNTPVVFVTCHHDFKARSRSALSGGSDLIAKPFLTFEIAVKALTLALMGRLHGRALISNAHQRANGFAVTSTIETKTTPAHHPVQEISVGTTAAAPPEMLNDGDHDGQTLTGSDHLVASTPRTNQESLPKQLNPTFDATIPGQDESIPSSALSPDKLTQAFLNRASAHLGPLRDLIQATFQTTDESARQGMLANFYISLNSFTPHGDTAKGHPAVQMCVALEGLLKKLLQNPKHGTSSTLLTVATAVDLLIDLCMWGAKPGLASITAIRTLAVDDDPIARRAITCALQMVFEKPESADNGEDALALAREKPFDVIFLDVQMPGMDGFTTCLRIRETAQNRTTPVVFVTRHSDIKARTQANVSGGSDLIAKPFLNAEIKVKALTYALRGRVQNLKKEERLTQFQRKNVQTRNDSIPVLT